MVYTNIIVIINKKPNKVIIFCQNFCLKMSSNNKIEVTKVLSRFTISNIFRIIFILFVRFVNLAVMLHLNNEYHT